MIKFFVLALVALVVAQRGNWEDWRQELGAALNVIDTFHGYRVQYDDEHNIFLFMNNLHCYVVEANTERWDEVVTNEAALHKFTEAVYAQISSSTGVTALTQAEATAAYHSRLEQWECRDKDVSKVAFAPTA